MSLATKATKARKAQQRARQDRYLAGRAKSLRLRPRRPGWSAIPSHGQTPDQRRKARRATP